MVSKVHKHLIINLLNVHFSQQATKLVTKSIFFAMFADFVKIICKGTIFFINNPHPTSTTTGQWSECSAKGRITERCNLSFKDKVARL